MSGEISFARGAPSLDIIDVDGLRQAAEQSFLDDAKGATAYGTAVGYLPLRRWIAERHGVAAERVIVTNGSMQADALLFERLIADGDGVIVERPSYDRTLLSLRQRGAEIHAIELDAEGIDVEATRLLLEQGTAIKLAHIIPNFQNPAGCTLAPTRRRTLLELAGRHNFIIFEDDPYAALRFSGESPQSMLSMDQEGGNVVYASSFSKTVCPGIRVGYLIGPESLIGEITRLATNTYISPSMVSQAIVHQFCLSGALERSIQTVRAALRERAGALADALRSQLPEFSFNAPEGGYFMWVRLPQGADVDDLHRAALERNVVFVKGTDFIIDGGEDALRLAYSGVSVSEINEGVSRLAEAWRSLG